MKAVQGQINDVVGIMKNNINKALDRGDKLSNIEGKV